IQAQEEISNISIVNAVGQVLKQWENAPIGHHELNLGGMAPGIYLIEINYTNGERQIGKVVLHR
ncbi:T9SS type A sorting domain-containing protein, partial [Arthrospira platensis SPKY1]|nr:T9SS type A sorting domain-containing protein [Arthrospira platensis SPKY1]